MLLEFIDFRYIPDEICKPLRGYCIEKIKWPLNDVDYVREEILFNIKINFLDYSTFMEYKLWISKI